MHLLNTLLAILSLAVARYAYKQWRARLAFRAAALQHGCRRPPRYPHRWPLGIDLLRARMAAVKAGRYNRLYLEQFRTYGKTWAEDLGGTSVINTMEPANFQAVAAGSFLDYGKPSMRSRALAPLLGNGIFSQDGATWRHSRDLIRPLFARAEVSDVDSFRIYVDRFLALIPRDGTTVDLQPLLLRLFLDSSTDFIFGESVDSLLGTPAHSQEFLDAFGAALMGAGKRAKADKLQFIFMLDDKQWKQAYQKVHAFIDQHVARALAETKPGADQTSSPTASTSTPPTPPQRYILIREMAKAIRDPVELRCQLLNVFFPARDSTGIALSNALFNLARHPAVWRELRAQALALEDRPLTFETLKSLHLFRYVLFEALRLQGPSGRVARIALRDTILPCGGGPDGAAPVFVSKGTIVALNTYAPNHWRETWGNDVEAFNPHRWVGSKHAWDWTPFLGGPRMCPAQQQVLTQAVYLLVRMVLAFEGIENRDSEVEYVELTKMLTESRNGVKVAFFAASASA